MSHDPYPSIRADRPRWATLEARWNYLNQHRIHDGTIALPVKRWNIIFTDQVSAYGDTPPSVETFFQLLEMPDHPFWTSLRESVEEFSRQHPNYQIVQAGRSGGWFELRSGGETMEVSPNNLENELDITFIDDLFGTIEAINDLFEVVWDFDEWVRQRITELVDFCTTHRFVEEQVEVRDTVTFLVEVEINPETGEVISEKGVEDE